MKIKFKKMHENAVIPAYANDYAAGLDLSTSKDVLVQAQEAILLPTGIAVEIPEGYVGILALRSSTPKKKGLFSPHGVGIIDSDYRGELFVQVAAMKEDIMIKAGERIAQLVITPARSVAGVTLTGVEEVRELTSTQRGQGGFGSTG
tara:strand:- start:7736 stop:8176 length:441 start_codon:yes stop_codon:yes gene_type:complete